ncbi:MAG: SDR family NAD(P)-dependent oxidoreductase, partial [Quisquiliibacterium sp.]
MPPAEPTAAQPATVAGEGAGRLAGTVALVTGASRGIGLAIAKAYAAEGASLCLAATDQAKLEQVQEALALPAGRTMVYQLDVSDAKACQAA